MTLTKTLIFIGIGIILMLILIISKGKKKGFRNLDLEEILSSFWIGGIITTGAYSLYITAIYIYLVYTSQPLPSLGEENIVVFLVGGIALLYLGIKSYARVLSD